MLNNSNFCRFETIEELNIHLQTHNGNDAMCDVCAKIIRGKRAFKRHQLEHEGVMSPRAQCDKCGISVKNKSVLRKHIKLHIEMKQAHKCDVCGKVCANRTAMTRHKKFVHYTKRSYKCNVCSKYFKTALHLREHIATHTGIYLYSCPHCTKTFNANGNLYAHLRRMHSIGIQKTRK